MIGIIILTSVALVLSIILVLVSNKLDTTDNTKEILDRLPGINCGACGFINCEGLAKAISEDPTLCDRCRVLKGEKLENFKQFIKEKYNI